MKNNIIYTISNYEKNITIDTLHNTIECQNTNYSGDIYPIIKLSHNNDHVLKFNKTCISSCNVEFLIAAIECDNALFNAIYTYVSTRNAIRDIKEYNEFYALTRASFYGLYNETPGALISMFKGLSHNSRQMFLSDHICYKHDAKMSGVISMSTYVGYNNFCIARCNNCNNAICKLSSLYLNTPEIDKARKYSFIRFLFTVYDDNYIKEHNIVINCGARHCITCGICYKYLHEFKHGLQLINERKK